MDHTNHPILKNLKIRKILHPDQWNKLYPRVDAPTSESFDITLLSLLLLNICNLPTPANGWDKEPASTSISQVDDIVRVKLYRNKLFHISEPAVSDADFNKYWNDIKTVLIRLGEDKAAIDHVRLQTMDPEDEKYYIECLKECAEKEERIIQAIKGFLDNHLKTSTSSPTRPSTSQDMDSYSQNLKKAIIKQTAVLPKGTKVETMKTDDIFTNLIIHHGKKSPGQTQRPEEDLLDRKALTEIKHCKDIFLDEQENDSGMRISLSGEAGIGKTLFSEKLLRDLASNTISIPDIKFTYLITFRQLNNLPSEEELNLRELLNRCPLLNESAMIDETVNLMEYIIQHPRQFFVVLDGFDEYRDRSKIVGDFESQFPNDGNAKMPVAALVSKLLRKKILSDSIVMVTSRPKEADEINQKIHFNRYVEISGFSESQIIEYVQKYFSTKPEEVRNKVINEVKGSAHYISFGRVPFRCLLMCMFLEWKIKNAIHDNIYFLTLTEFYFEIMKCIERNYNRAILSLDEKDASLAVDKTLDNFAKLAAYLDQQSRFTFTLQDLENLRLTENELLHIQSSSLIFCYPVFNNDLPFRKQTCEYSFAHLTIQEFFLAQYFVKEGSMAGHRTTDMVYRFMSGLLGLKNTDKLMPELLEYIGKHVEYTPRIVSLRCLYEYGQDKSLTRKELITNRDNIYWSIDGLIKLAHVTDTDCGAITMLLESTATSMSSPPHGLLIGSSQLTCYGLSSLLLPLIPPNCTITDLRLIECGLRDEHAECLGQHLHDTKITCLSLSSNKITNAGVRHIVSGLPEKLTYLCLSRNRISDGGLDHIVRRLRTRDLSELHLDGNRISDECGKRNAQICEDRCPGLKLVFYI